MLLPTIVHILTYINGSSIYLSSLEPITSQTLELQKEEIDVVISLMEEIHVPKFLVDSLNGDRKFRHYYFNIKDTFEENIEKHFVQIYYIIFRALEHEERVLIHCRSGVSCCVTVLISFLLYSLYKTQYKYMIYNYIDYFPKTKFTWTESFLDYIQKVYPQAKPNDSFIQQLLHFEKDLIE